jgi:hypothetical protein
MKSEDQIRQDAREGLRKFEITTNEVVREQFRQIERWSLPKKLVVGTVITLITTTLLLSTILRICGELPF